MQSTASILTTSLLRRYLCSLCVARKAKIRSCRVKLPANTSKQVEKLQYIDELTHSSDERFLYRALQIHRYTEERRAVSPPPVWPVWRRAQQGPRDQPNHDVQQNTYILWGGELLRIVTNTTRTIRQKKGSTVYTCQIYGAAPLKKPGASWRCQETQAILEHTIQKTIQTNIQSFAD